MRGLLNEQELCREIETSCIFFSELHKNAPSGMLKIYAFYIHVKVHLSEELK